MRILAVDHTAVLSSHRAVYRAIRDLHEIDLTLLIPQSWRDQSGYIVAEAEASTLPVHTSPTIFKGKSHRVLYGSLRSVFKQLLPDVIYVNSEPEGYLAWQAIRLRKSLSGHSVVVFDSWRNVDHSEVGFPYKLAPLHVSIERRVLREADHCVAHNKSAARLFKQMGFDRVTIIPPAVDTSIFRPADTNRAITSSTRDKFVIGFVGRFVPEKGVDVLLHAAAQLDFPFRIILVGHGPALKSWQDVARDLDIGERITWQPPVAHTRIPAMLSEMDVLVLPSRSTRYWKEQFGRVLIEAMACGIPLIGSSCGEIPEVIGKAGLIFDEGNSERLADNLKYVYSDTQLRSDLARSGLERVRSLYEVHQVAQQYADLFSSLLPSR